MKIKVLIPVYNDWQSISKLLENINSEVSDLNHEFSVLIVNDASTDSRPDISINLKNLKSIKVINMKENKGHGRCNAAGLKFVFEKEEFDYVILMDGDGEDRPEEIKQFIDKINYSSDKPIVGERVKRSESKLFKFCYRIHKILTLVFTSKSIKFGHFTCLPKSVVKKMINEKATWNNFSGSLVKISKDRIAIPSIRGTRYYDQSKMSYFNLVLHSLSIISVFKLNVLIRSIVFLAIYIFFILQNISVITLIPVVLVIIMIFSVFILSRRENITELNNSLSNILNIDDIKS